MRPTRGGESPAASAAARLTRLGSLLREGSIDELPTLWKVLRGDMSLVGPRPLLMQYLTRHTPEQARRHLVKPGMTGWTQVNGRNSISWDDKLALDVWYVDHQSLMLDFKILAMTILKVLRRDGISAAGCATMPEFFGSVDNHTQPAVADVALAAGYERVVFGDDDPSKPRLLLAAVVSPISDRVVVFGVPCRVVSEV
jgi:hypothetical protein